MSIRFLKQIFWNKAALTDLFNIMGGRIVRHRQFLQQAQTWANSAPRNLKWSLGDIEPFTMRIRIMQMHLRDARRDGKLPPSNHTNLQGLMNMVHIDAIHDSNDDFEAVDEISQIRPRPLSAPLVREADDSRRSREYHGTLPRAH